MQKMVINKTKPIMINNINKQNKRTNNETAASNKPIGMKIQVSIAMCQYSYVSIAMCLYSYAPQLFTPYSDYFIT